MSSCIDFQAIAEEYLSANSLSNLYFLLDHSGMTGLYRKLGQNPVEWASLFEGTQERNLLRVAPILVLIGANGRLRMRRSLFKWIGENGTYSSTVIILASPLPIGILKSRLSSRLEVRLSENMQAMLRFFDPRVLEMLVKVLSVEQATAFFSPVEQWWYVDRAGKLVSHATAFEVAEELEPSLTLSAAQEFDLIDASEPDQVLALLRGNFPDLMLRLPLPIQYEFVARNIEAARDAGLSSTMNFMLYNAVVLVKGQDFIRGPVWTSALSAIKSNSVGFAQMVATLDVGGTTGA